MTKLRKDGKLETDDPVVSSCFLEKQVTVLHNSIPEEECRPLHYDVDIDKFTEEDLTGRLLSVCSEGVWVVEQTYADYPILVPAKTVKLRVNEDSLVWLVIVGTIEDDETIVGGDRFLGDWLRTHVQ